MEEPVGRSLWSWGVCQDLTALDRRNQSRFVVLSVAWAVSFVAATFVLTESWVGTRPLAVIVALTPTIIGVVTLRAYITFVRDADEMIRNIHLESLALGFGAGVLFMFGYRLLERIGAPILDMNDGLLVMVVVWSVAQLVLSRRYS